LEGDGDEGQIGAVKFHAKQCPPDELAAVYPNGKLWLCGHEVF
jgi:hypothetical protein